MTDTPREDYEIRCEDAARELIRFMEGLREVSFTYSQADEWGEDDEWSWVGTLKVEFEHRDRWYEIPCFSDEESGEIQFGEYDHPWGDSREDLWRIIWIEEVEAHVETAVATRREQNDDG